jgi:uncharacterized protein (UPF0210 family)
MKIRAITIGITLSRKKMSVQIARAAKFLARAKDAFVAGGFDVQTTRISTQPWPVFCKGLGENKVVQEIQTIEEICHNEGVEFVSVGTAVAEKSVDLVPEIVCITKNVSASITIADRRRFCKRSVLHKAARAILRIAHDTEQGYGNFRCATIACCPPDIPFYPASFHKGTTCFSIALESSDIVRHAFSKARDIDEAETRYRSAYEAELTDIRFKGIDLSPAPSLQKTGSLVYAFEKLGIATFGAPGTLALCALITRVLHSVRVRKCGYSGLMLPVLEDCGLARRYSEGAVSINKILAYSAVCGTGLDCIPLPGDVSEQKLVTILLDVATLALKLRKPLSARLLPVPGKQVGDRTNFRSPYLTDCTIQSV